MVKELRQLMVAAVVGIGLAVALICSVGCATGCRTTAGKTEPAVRSALDAFALVVEPAWDVHNEVCAVQQEAVAAEVEARRITPDQGDAQNAATRERCQERTRIFQAIRAAQDQAADLVEAGRIKEAEAWLVRLQDEWRELRAVSARQPDGGA